MIKPKNKYIGIRVHKLSVSWKSGFLSPRSWKKSHECGTKVNEFLDARSWINDSCYFEQKERPF
jgi:hypothetical protein